MKTFLVLATLLFLGDSASHAVESKLGLYADQVGINCDVGDVGPDTLTLYVVHTSSTVLLRASLFAAPVPTCMVGVTWIGDIHFWPDTHGDSQSGAAVAYASDCTPGPVVVMGIRYVTSGTTQTCCRYPLLPEPPSRRVEAILCGLFLEFPDIAAPLAVNGDPTCDCTLPVPVEETTWGRIKTIYLR